MDVSSLRVTSNGTDVVILTKENLFKFLQIAHLICILIAFIRLPTVRKVQYYMK